LQELRDVRHQLNQILSGWHFSYFGGEEYIKLKINSIVEGYSVMSQFNLTYTDILNNFYDLKDLYGRVGMNFKLIQLEGEYPEYILSKIKNHPIFIKST